MTGPETCPPLILVTSTFTTSFACAAIVFAFHVGCACTCDVFGAIQARAGAGATDCGLVPLGADPTAALDCAEAAIAAGHGVIVGWHRQGVDSEERTYIAGHDGSFSMFGYDGDPSGGSHQCPTLDEYVCDGPVTRVTAPSGMMSLTCHEASSHRVCDSH